MHPFSSVLSSLDNRFKATLSECHYDRHLLLVAELRRREDILGPILAIHSHVISPEHIQCIEREAEQRRDEWTREVALYRSRVCANPSFTRSLPPLEAWPTHDHLVSICSHVPRENRISCLPAAWANLSLVSEFPAAMKAVVGYLQPAMNRPSTSLRLGTLFDTPDQEIIFFLKRAAVYISWIHAIHRGWTEAEQSHFSVLCLPETEQRRIFAEEWPPGVAPHMYMATAAAMGCVFEGMPPTNANFSFTRRSSFPQNGRLIFGNCISKLKHMTITWDQFCAVAGKRDAGFVDSPIRYFLQAGLFCLGDLAERYYALSELAMPDRCVSHPMDYAPFYPHVMLSRHLSNETLLCKGDFDGYAYRPYLRQELTLQFDGYSCPTHLPHGLLFAEILLAFMHLRSESPWYPLKRKIQDFYEGMLLKSMSVAAADVALATQFKLK